jgi:transcriptional regulator with XRE-family HTH domain
MCHFVVTGDRDSRLMGNSQGRFTLNGEIGERLRAERTRLGLNQSDFAQVGGVSLNTQSRYESKDLPALEYLLRIAEAGADWYWIVSGQRVVNALDDRAAEVAELFPQLPVEVGDGLLITMRAIARAYSEG